MAPRSSADLRSVVAATLQRKSITLSVIGAACSEYELKCDGQRLEHIGYSGRGEAPRAFERHTSGERDEAFEALEQNRPRLVPDIRVQKAQGRSQRGIDRGYLTYIAVPIVVGEDRFGMLTLDAPEANSFTDTDLRLSQFVAELLGIAFACAKYD